MRRTRLDTASRERASGVERVAWIACCLALAWIGVACRAARPIGIPAVRSPYDALSPVDATDFAHARSAFEAGKLDEAASEFTALRTRLPQNIPVGVWLQEVELAQAARSADPAAATEALRQRYRSEAEAQPSVVRLVLAARIEPDAPAATLLLDRAEGLDADCAWVHYGGAYLATRASDWPAARLALSRAREAEPGHLPTRGLEAWMLAQGGDARLGITALETWLERARNDPTIFASQLRAIEIDLALLYVRDGEPKRAAEILDALPADDSDAGRRLTLLAAAEQELGHDMLALSAARNAEKAAPGDLLPVVQQALLHDLWLHDPAAAEAAWIRVLGISRSDRELDGLLELLRARVRLERLQLARDTARRQP